VITEATGKITLIPENIPEELTERPQWVCWRYEERSGKQTKVPYTPDTGVRASATDLLSWRTFEDVVMSLDPERFPALRMPQYDGIGFVLSSADPYVGIDLDDCRDPDTGEIAPWAQKILDRVQTGYIEISPSGTGVHVIVEGTVRSGGMQKQVRVDGEVVGKVEMYSRERFFTMTGRTL
jgi:putative DNA primase/helicase